MKSVSNDQMAEVSGGGWSWSAALLPPSQETTAFELKQDIGPGTACPTTPCV